MFKWFKLFSRVKQLESENHDLIVKYELEVGQLLAELHEQRLKIVCLEQERDELAEQVKDLTEKRGCI